MAKCAMCGRPTTPYVMIGNEAIGPKCARRAGLTPTNLPKGTKLRFIRHEAKHRQPVPETPDLFEGLENDEAV